VPFTRELLLVQSEHLLDSDQRVGGLGGDVEHLPDLLVAPSSAYVRPERLAPPVREVLRVVEILDIG
jgi:hypothetical protein